MLSFLVRGRNSSDGPTLLPSQETSEDTQRRLKLTPEQFEQAKLIGLPEATIRMFTDSRSRYPRQAHVRLKRDVDKWVLSVKALAKALK